MVAVPQFNARSLTELVNLRATTQGDEPAVHTGAAEFGDELQTLSYSDLQRAVDRLAAHYAKLGLQPPRPADGSLPPERVIAVLTSTAVDEPLLEIALAKLGLAPLLLSVNNSVAAVAHLCKITKATHLVYGTRFAETSAEAQALLAKEGISLEIVPETRFPLWGPGGVSDPKVNIPEVAPALNPDEEHLRTCVILHSSGSTGFPKPVFITHKGMIANCALSVPKTGFSALPLFHGFGHFSIFRCLYNAKAFTLLPPHLPITAANIVRTIERSPTRPVQHFAVPYVLKLLAEDEAGVASLAAMETVSFAGAAVPDDLGDRLTAAGVKLVSFYGTTETGGAMTSKRDFETDKGWNWVRAEGNITNFLELVPHGEDTVEVVVLDGWPAKIMSNRPDGAYATKDLFAVHPEHKTWLRYVGRLDDTLTQTLGEKTNPVPIELAIRGNSPLVQECIVFGDARPQVGALILPSDAAAELSKDRKAYIDAIWPVIADANSRAPTHSRILPEMVEILPYGTEIPVATKLSILRPACYKKFADIIDAVYDRFERGGDEPKLDLTTVEELAPFVKDTIVKALGDRKVRGLEDDTNLFEFGVDSLTATKVRNVFQKRLELGGAQLGQNVVYEHPSIRELAAHLLSARSGVSANGENEAEKAHASMLALVDKWASKLEAPVPAKSADSQVVVLTGATGSLGAHILATLTASSAVSTVICLSRASSDADSLDRLKSSLSTRKRTLTEAQLAKVESYAADTNATDGQLGLAPEVYASLVSRATAVIHNAWPVNFNLGVTSFEPHIGGAVALVNLASRAGAVFFFSSSVGTRQGQTGLNSAISEDFPEGPQSAGPMGYARSKWVVEKIVQRAGKGGARGGVLRIGQLVGDTVNGVWNETEAWPLMFRSVNEIHALPDLTEQLQWLPVDLAAEIISEVVLSSSSSSSTQVYHILNAHETPFASILTSLRAAGLEFDTVSRAEWLARLRASNPDVGANPTYKLLGFYEGRFGADESRGAVKFQVSKSEQASETLKGLGSVEPRVVGLWVKAWVESGFIKV